MDSLDKGLQEYVDNLTAEARKNRPDKKTSEYAQLKADLEAKKAANLDAVEKMLRRLENGDYGDYTSDGFPKMELAKDLTNAGFKDMVGNVLEGKYDF